MLERYLEELKRISLLTPEEERALWKAYKDDGDMASRRKLIEQYQPLVFKEAMRWHIRADLLPDAVQEGTVGLIEAVERFDYRRNVAFPLFAVHRIRGEIVDYLNKEGSMASLSIDEPDENGLTLREMLPDDDVDIAEQTVLEGVYLQDKQQKYLARDMDVSLPYVYRLQKRGIRRVRGMLSQFIHDCKKK